MVGIYFQPSCNALLQNIHPIGGNMPKPKSRNLNVESFNIGQVVADCQIDSSGIPVIAIGDKTFTNLLTLIKAFPILESEDNIKSLALAANFLFQGIKFHIIDDASKYQTEYLKRIEFEEQNINQNLRRLSDYGIFDVSTIHEPKRVEGKFIFFVREDYTDLPYRVTFDSPIVSESPEVKYELLHYK